MEGPVLVRLLGKFAVSAPSGTAIDLPTQKAKALLARIVLAGADGVDRSAVAGMLWSRGSDAQARTNLRQTLASLRKAFAGLDLIDSEGSVLRLRAGAVTSDVADVDQGSVAPHVETLGPLLEGVEIDEPGFADWLSLERASWQTKVTTALFDLAEVLIGEGKPGEASSVNQKLIALDAFDEGAHRQAMRLFASQGASAKALRHYDDLCGLLERELSTTPSDATRQLANSLRSSEYPSEPLVTARPQGDRKTSVIAVPFTQYGEGLDEGFGLSLAEDIAVELGRFATLRVLRQGAEQPDADYVVEGSVRASGERLRVSIQLVDGHAGGLIWADRYKMANRDSFDLLEDITRRAVATLPGRIQADVAERATRMSLDALGAHELMLRGKMLRDRLSADAMLEARRVLQQAVALDASNARAQMYLSDTYVIDGWLGLGDDRTADRALRHARLAVAADHSDVFVQDHLGFAYLSNGMWQDGRAQIERTLQAIRHEVESSAWCGYALALLGDREAALREVLDATSRDQMPLATFGWIRGQVFSLNGRYDEAIDALRGAASLNSLALAFLAGDYARLGRVKEAGAVLAEFVSERRAELVSRDIPVGGDSVATLAGGFRDMWCKARDWQHIADGLELAGLSLADPT